MSTTLTDRIAAMTDEQFERWLKQKGYRGMAAVMLTARRRAARRAAVSKPTNGSA